MRELGRQPVRVASAIAALADGSIAAISDGWLVGL